MLLSFIFVFLCSIVHHNYVVHISRVDHWYFCRTWHLITAAIYPIGHRLVFWLVSWQLVTTITLETFISCRAVQRVQGEGLHVLLEVLALFDLAALPELNDQVSVLADLTFRLKWIVPFFVLKSLWPTKFCRDKWMQCKFAEFCIVKKRERKLPLCHIRRGLQKWFEDSLLFALHFP